MRTLRLSLLVTTLFLASCTSEAEQTVIPTPSSMAATSSTSSAPAPTASVLVSERMQSGGILQLGDKNAAVSMLLFVNHSSDYSQTFHQTLLPRIMTDFVETGKIQLGIVPMQFIKYPESNISTSMFVCATLQGKGQAMNDLLFSQVSPAVLQKNIATMGLDIEKLKACLGNEPMKKQMDAEAQLAQDFSITTVPSYVINGAVYTGLPEYADLRAQIELALSKSN